MKNTSNLTIFTLLLLSSLTIMVGSVIAPSLSAIVRETDFNYSPGWLITLPSLGVVVFAPIIGKLLNKVGAYKMLCYGLVPYAVLGVLGAYITNDYLLILDRFFLGAATVSLQIAVSSLIADLFTGANRMKMIAWQGMAIELGGVVFLSLGGVLGEWNWHYPFYIYLIALICLILVTTVLSKEKNKTEQTKETLSSKENKPKVKLIFYASILSMVLFFISFVTLPIYLPHELNFTESHTGYYMAFISLIAIITASQMPKVVQKIGDGKTISFGFLCFMLGYIFLASFSTFSLLILAAIFIGIGFGFTIPLLNHMMIEASASKNLGKNLGLYSMGVFGGQFLSTFIEYLSKDYTIIYSSAAILALLISLSLFYAFKNIKNQ